MCIGIPMQVIRSEGTHALCVRADGSQMLIDMMLVGEQAENTWVLTFMQAAREVISEAHAMEINNALSALEATLQGETEIDHLFADLIDREPTLPDHLK